jgi:hypothetical protein
VSQSLLTIRTPQNTYEVVVTSFEYASALSSLYKLELKGRLTDLPEGLVEALQQHPAASFSYFSADQTRTYNLHGVIMASEIFYDPTQQCFFLNATLRPKLSLLSDSLVVQIFPNKSIQEILTSFFNTASQYIGPINYQLVISDAMLTKPLPGIEIQYAKSDYEYLQHLCRYGLFFYFVQGEDQEKIIITDQVESTSVHAEAIQVDLHLRSKPHIDNPIFNWMSQQTKVQAYQAKARHYNPLNTKQSLQQMTANVAGNEYAVEGLIFELSDQDTLNQRLTASMNAQQSTIELRGNYSALYVGERIRFKDERQLVYALNLTGMFSQGRWAYTTIVKLLPEAKVYYGESPFYVKKPLPGNLYAAALQASEQVNPNGYFRAQMTKPFIQQNAVNPDVLLRDIQGTSTQAGGSSHSTTYGAELVLTTHNGQSADILIAGGLSNAKYPANVTTQNEQDSALKNQGGLEVRLRRKRDNQPHAHIHMGVTDASQAQSFVRMGGHQEPRQDPQYGMQEGSTGFAKKVTGKHALKQVGQDIQNPVYKFQHQQTEEGKHDIKEQINTDSYSQRYYTSALSGDSVLP